ncbi:MAG: pyrroline-5-carboxylate reductase [Candidatus Pacebacteria bacterium]|nr:pyrroline-5-carboxylate reductase [Candidatus Paceibacterota bacterium]
MSRDKEILIVGTGKMGTALINGWSYFNDFAVIGIDPLTPTLDDLNEQPFIFYHSFDDYLDGYHKPKAIVFAIKPQSFPEVLPQYRAIIEADKPLVISIAAGITVETIRRLSGAKSVIRAMPNLPATVGEGMTALLADDCFKHQIKLAEELMEAVGEVEWLTRESDFDAVTALSGSGPAYVFLLAEYLAEAGVSLGLEPEVANRLAIQTVAGAGRMLYLAEDSPSELRKMVTSKGGTTEAALKILMRDGGLKQELIKAVTAAFNRSQELGKK